MKTILSCVIFAAFISAPFCSYAQPANDDACDAIQLVVDDPAISSMLVGATAQTDEVSPPMGSCFSAWCDFVPVSNSAWFTFIAPSNGAVEVSTCLSGTDLDTQLALWDVGNCSDFGTYSFVGANDDVPGDCDSGGDIYASLLNLDGLTPGATYYVQVDGFDGQEGDFEIQVSTGIPTSNVLIAHNSADLAIATVDIRLNGELIADDISFRESTLYLSVVSGPDQDLTICDASSENADAPLYQVSASFDSAKDYVIVVSGIYSDSGYSPSQPLTLSIYDNAQLAPMNQGSWDILFFHGCTDAPVIDIEAIELGGSTVADNLAFGEFNQDGYVSLATGNYSFELADENGSSLGIISCAPFALFGQGSNAVTILASGFLDPSMNSDGAPFGMFIVSPFGGSFIELFPGECPVPENDRPCDAVELIVNDPPLTFDNSFAVADEGEPVPPNLPLNDPEADCINQWCDGAGAQNTLWFTFVAPATTVGITTCFANSFDTQLGVWTVGNCEDYSTFTYVAANDDADGGCGAGGSIYSAAFYALDLTIGQTYYIQLDGWGGDTGSFDIQLIAEVGVEEMSAPLLQIFPNPAADMVTLEGTLSNCMVSIDDVTGRKMDSFVLNGKLNYDLSGYERGVYLVSVLSEGKTQVSRLVID